MINGQTVSPLHNGNIGYYGAYPAELIERVEVIRGPGSAVCGQFAGAAVINMHTRSTDSMDGGSLRAAGHHPGRWGPRRWRVPGGQWAVLPGCGHLHHGGFSGGSLQSPALCRYLADRRQLSPGKGEFPGQCPVFIFQTYSIFFAFRGYLNPELIRSLELELGWRFAPNVQAKVNL